VLRIKETFNRAIPVEILFQHQTVAELAIYLREQLPREEEAPVLEPFQTKGTRLPFFCIHPFGGEVYEYHNLSRYVGEAQPFYGIRMPDPQKHSTAFRTLEGIAAYYISVIKEVQPQGPYQLGGWSAGGLIAYEMARQLVNQGDEVRRLALLDSDLPAPHQRVPIEDDSGIDDADLTRYFMRRYQITLPAEIAERGDPVAQFASVYEQLKQRDIAPRDVRLEQIRFFARVWKTVGNALARYIPQPYAGQIDLFRASDANGSRQDAGQLFNGWEELALQGVRIHLVLGSHITLMEEPYIRDLAASLAACLAPEQSEQEVQ
jgi:thioesterase domain-containing protein